MDPSFIYLTIFAISVLACLFTISNRKLATHDYETK